MHYYKCKKSVFCGYFWFFFFLGTISGVFAFQCLLGVSQDWMRISTEHSACLADVCFGSYLGSALRPLMIVSVLAFHPKGHRAVFWLVFLRGFLTSYCISALGIAGSATVTFFIKEFLVLLLFYVLSKWTYFRWG